VPAKLAAPAICACSRRRRAASSGEAADCALSVRRSLASAPWPGPRRPLKICAGLIPMIFRPTTAWARSIRSLRKQRPTSRRSWMA
jgi:hypothetical protein